jgi:lipopolysaccharide transport system ATP-binding protein
MEDVLISVKGVSKKFARDLKRSLYHGLSDVVKGVLHIPQKPGLRKSEFWAVSDVSFDVRRGECIGLIGHNGAGKSTLLKMLNGLIGPDAGSITMRGKIGALIELGAGFNPILTGRENIYNNGAVIGFSKKEIDAKFDSIVEFAEIGSFVDTPVQNYSSGMKVRLGFAIAAQMEPDVLLIDEVLAVGDLGFKIKCMNRIQQLMKKCAVIFVSHAMTQVTVVCTGIVLMDKGRVVFAGNDVGEGVEKYFGKFDQEVPEVIAVGATALRDVKLSAPAMELNGTDVAVSSGDPLTMEFTVHIPEDTGRLAFRVAVFNMEYRLVAEVDSENADFTPVRENGHVKVRVQISGLYLRYGRYSVHLHVTDTDKKLKLLRQSGVASFYIRHTATVGADFLLPAEWS